MIRLLQILVLFFLLWLAVRFIKRLLGARKSVRPLSRQTAIDVLPCAYCGEHIPRPDAIIKGDKVYCSQAHYEADL